MTIPTQIFKSYDIRGLVDGELTEGVVEAIGHAMACDLGAGAAPKRVAVARDMRASSPALLEAVVRGLRKGGASVRVLGMTTTPMLNYYVGMHDDVDGGVMVTASHNPAAWNGLKLCYGDVRPFGLDTGLGALRDRMLADDLPITDRPTVREDVVGWPETYLDLLVPERGVARGLKVVVDAGNGAVGPFVHGFAERLGIELVPLFLEPDGTFPNHEANPLKTETLRDLQRVVVEQGADVGIAFDADGDRIGAVDERGRVVSGDYLGLWIAAGLLAEHPGARILADVRCSRDIQSAIEAQGGRVSLSPVGHAHIKRQMREEGAIFAIELSAHFYYADRFYVESALRSMAFLLQALKRSGQPASVCIDTYRHHTASGEINFSVQDAAGIMKDAKRTFGSEGTLTLIDGVRVDLTDAWFSLRMSNTEPVVRLNVEAMTEGGMSALRDRLTHWIEQHPMGGRVHS